MLERRYVAHAENLFRHPDLSGNVSVFAGLEKLPAKRYAALCLAVVIRRLEFSIGSLTLLDSVLVASEDGRDLLICALDRGESFELIERDLMLIIALLLRTQRWFNSRH